MMSPLSQLLILFSSAALPQPEPDVPKQVTAAYHPYRSRCHECDDEGRDARFPCEGHD